MLYKNIDGTLDLILAIVLFLIIFIVGIIFCIKSIFYFISRTVASPKLDKKED